jgi:teichoic acid transport system ATP-binding protein
VHRTLEEKQDIVENDDEQLMPQDIAICVRNLGKKYLLYDSPKHRLKEALHPFRKKYCREFWALRDVSLEVRKGECLGIIGKNGSGKSTLLQLLAGVLQPTTGEMSVNGRISALLELGTGFSPELTGRENVYINGSIMGYSRREMDERMRPIISFADIGEFIDQPVKTYSSGMFVRLAFAAAIHVDPDILIVDEALAVGDLRFQKKCKEHINNFMHQGKSIILVSHVMSDISAVCRTALFLQDGLPSYYGDVSEAINMYSYEGSKAEINQVGPLESGKGDSHTLPSSYGGDRGGTNDIIISRVCCYQKGGDKDVSEIQFGENILIELDYTVRHPIENPIFRVNLSTMGHRFFANIDSTDAGLLIPSISGKGCVVVEIKNPNLYPQAYTVNVGVVSKYINVHFFFWNEAASFIIRPPAGRAMAYDTALIALECELTLCDADAAVSRKAMP